MPPRHVSATALARNFSHYLNQVRYQGVTLEVKRGNEVVACVTPPASVAGFPIAQLDALFASMPAWAEDEARDFLHDIHSVTDRLIAEDSAWDS